jgi:hypothetical protein
VESVVGLDVLDRILSDYFDFSLTPFHQDPIIIFTYVFTLTRRADGQGLLSFEYNQRDATM